MILCRVVSGLPDSWRVWWQRWRWRLPQLIMGLLAALFLSAGVTLLLAGQQHRLTQQLATMQKQLQQQLQQRQEQQEQQEQRQILQQPQQLEANQRQQQLEASTATATQPAPSLLTPSPAMSMEEYMSWRFQQLAQWDRSLKRTAMKITKLTVTAPNSSVPPCPQLELKLQCQGELAQLVQLFNLQHQQQPAVQWLVLHWQTPDDSRRIHKRGRIQLTACVFQQLPLPPPIEEAAASVITPAVETIAAVTVTNQLASDTMVGPTTDVVTGVAANTGDVAAARLLRLPDLTPPSPLLTSRPALQQLIPEVLMMVGSLQEPQQQLALLQNPEGELIMVRVGDRLGPHTERVLQITSEAVITSVRTYFLTPGHNFHH